MREYFFEFIISHFTNILTQSVCLCYLFLGRSANTQRVLQTLQADISDFSGASDNDDDDDPTFTATQMDVSSEQSEDSLCASDADPDDSSDDEPLLERSRRWRKVDIFEPSVINFDEQDANVESREEWVPLDYVNEYIDRKLFQMISRSTNLTSTMNTGKSLNTTAREIERFLGSSIFMSSFGYPQMDMFWCTSTRLPCVADTISRKRYYSIRSQLKVVVDSEVADDVKHQDRLWKVRPMMDRIR